jgi:hypothetical protein
MPYQHTDPKSVSQIVQYWQNLCIKLDFGTGSNEAASPKAEGLFSKFCSIPFVNSCLFQGVKGELNQFLFFFGKLYS